MIAFLSGRLLRKELNEIILLCAGVGYSVQIPMSTYQCLPEEGADVEVEVYTLVKEDSIQLFGFAGRQEKEIFQMLIGVTKVGPKVALGCLSGMDPILLLRSIRDGDIPQLSRIHGVGKRTAERIILECRDRIENFMPGSLVTEGEAWLDRDEEQEAVSALRNLGYRANQAEDAVRRVVAKLGKQATMENIVRGALGSLVAPPKG